MPRQRPTVLTVMGILNIVLGSLFVLCNICGGIGLLFGASGQGRQFQGGPNPFAEINELFNFLQAEIPSFVVIKVCELVVSLLASVLLVIAGIGLLSVRNWGRILSIAYSVIGILVTLGSLVFTLAIVNPATERFINARLAIGGQPGMNNTAFNSIVTVFSAVISMAYAIVLLIMMLLPSVSATFAGRSRTDDYDLDRPDDEDDLGRERRRGEEWHE